MKQSKKQIWLLGFIILCVGPVSVLQGNWNLDDIFPGGIFDKDVLKNRLRDHKNMIKGHLSDLLPVDARAAFMANQAPWARNCLGPRVADILSGYDTFVTTYNTHAQSDLIKKYLSIMVLESFLGHRLRKAVEALEEGQEATRENVEKQLKMYLYGEYGKRRAFGLKLEEARDNASKAYRLRFQENVIRAAIDRMPVDDPERDERVAEANRIGAQAQSFEDKQSNLDDAVNRERDKAKFWLFLEDTLRQKILDPVADPQGVITPMLGYLELIRDYHVIEGEGDGGGGHKFNAGKYIHEAYLNNNSGVFIGYLSNGNPKTFFPVNYTEAQIFDCLRFWKQAAGIVTISLFQLCNAPAAAPLSYGYKAHRGIVLETAFPLFSFYDTAVIPGPQFYLGTVVDTWEGHVFNRLKLEVPKNDLISYAKCGKPIRGMGNAATERFVIMDKPLTAIFKFSPTIEGFFIVRMSKVEYDGAPDRAVGDKLIKKARIVWT